MSTSQTAMRASQPPHVDMEMSQDRGEAQAKSASDKASEFLDGHAAKINSMFGAEGSKPLQRTLEVEPRTFSQSTRREVEQFLEIMDNHQSSMRDNSLKLIDLRAKTSWNDMLKAATEAETAYQKASRTRLRRAGRRMSELSESAQPYLRLIPSDSYGATLYGGLRLVFQAASQLDERRMKVLKSFLRIPSIILQAEGCVQNFPSDQLLYQRAEEVFLAALPVIEGVTRWLRQNQAVKQLRALLLGSRYNKSFKEKLLTLDEALEELQERTSFLRDQSILKTEKAVADVKHVVDCTDTQMSAVLEDLKSSAKAHEQTKSMMSDINDLEEIRKDARRAISIVLEQTIKTSQWMEEKDRALRRLKSQLEALEKAGATLTHNDLLDLLDVRIGDVREEFRRLQRACRLVEVSECRATLNILKNHRLKEWLSADAASALFVESRASSLSTGRTTPLSFLSTEVIDKLRDREPAVAIYFFCGHHSSSTDPVRGPVGLMRSLISQVLHLYSVQLDFIGRRVSQQLEQLHLYTLCDTFVKLVKRLPHSVVLVCVIDGISFFETREWATDCRFVINEMRELLNDDEVPPVFKLLVTSPVRSRHVVNEFSDQYRLILPDLDDIDSRHEPTEREINMSRTRPMPPMPRNFPASMRNRRYHQNVSARQSEYSSSDSSDGWLEDIEDEMEVEIQESLQTTNSAESFDV